MLLRLLLLLPSSAHAQDGAPVTYGTGFDAHGFHLAAFDGDLRDPLMVPRAGRFESGDFFLGGVFEYAEQPLTLIQVDPDGNIARSEAALDNLAALNLSAGVAVLDRLRLDVTLPVYLSSTGLGGASNGTGVGDTRISATVAVARPHPDGGFGLALVPYVNLPTGDSSNFLGSSKVDGGGSLALTGEVDGLTLTGAAGVAFNPTLDLYNLTGADSVLLGGGIGYLLTPYAGLNLEYHQDLPLQTNEETGTAAPGEAIGSLRFRSKSGANIVLGGAVGVGNGVSTAAWRLFAGGGFGRIGAPTPKVNPDPDQDGILGLADACPDAPEVVNQYVDQDGCPDGLGRIAVRVFKDGQPVEGIPVHLAPSSPEDTARDVTSTAAGALTDVYPDRVWTGTARSGSCLAGTATVTAVQGTIPMDIALAPALDAMVNVKVYDKTGDALPDAVVRWDPESSGCVPVGESGPGPQKAGAGAHRLIVTAPGYTTEILPVNLEAHDTRDISVTLEPARVKVTATQIVILDRVYFDYDSDKISGTSFSLLDQVANTILANPQLGVIEVAGHTDSDGSDTYNLNLSQRRVNAVRDYLVARGVDSARLTPHGYGETRPIDTNATDAGKARNRRVEFNIVGAAPKP